MVIIVFGLPGSGKSYFAGRLAKSLDAIYVNSDIERIKLIRQRRYTFSEKMMVYDRMFELMVTAVMDGKSIVLDATFYLKSIRNRFIQKATELGQTALFIEVTAKTETIKKDYPKNVNIAMQITAYIFH
jgi:predicted kinase